MRGCGPFLRVCCGSPLLCPHGAALSGAAMRSDGSGAPTATCGAGTAGGGGGGTPQHSETKRYNGTPTPPHTPHLGPHCIARAEFCVRGGEGPKSERARRRCAVCARGGAGGVDPRGGWEGRGEGKTAPTRPPLCAGRCPSFIFIIIFVSVTIFVVLLFVCRLFCCNRAAPPFRRDPPGPAPPPLHPMPALPSLPGGGGMFGVEPPPYSEVRPINPGWAVRGAGGERGMG